MNKKVFIIPLALMLVMSLASCYSLIFPERNQNTQTPPVTEQIPDVESELDLDSEYKPDYKIKRVFERPTPIILGDDQWLSIRAISDIWSSVGPGQSGGGIGITLVTKARDLALLDINERLSLISTTTTIQSNENLANLRKNIFLGSYDSQSNYIIMYNDLEERVLLCSNNLGNIFDVINHELYYTYIILTTSNELRFSKFYFASLVGDNLLGVEWATNSAFVFQVIESKRTNNLVKINN